MLPLDRDAAIAVIIGRRGMTVINRKRGAWVNQFSQPPDQRFLDRARQVDYVVVKYGLARYERLAHANGIPWLAERMGCDFAGDQAGRVKAGRYGRELSEQANQPGCVGAVINLEEADGGWHLDDGSATRLLISTFRAKAAVPLFASLDTRGNRANYPYQRACAALCDGVMPMIYPGAFQQSAPIAFAASLNELMRHAWDRKEIYVTYQAYGGADVDAQVTELRKLDVSGVIAGANAYTLGHATDQQWRAALTFSPSAGAPVPPAPDVPRALKALRELWISGWHAIEQKGTVEEAAAFAQFWRSITGR